MDRPRFTSDVRPYAETPHAPHWAVGVSYVPRPSTRRIPRPKIHTSLTLVTLFPSSCRHCSPRHTLRRALACPPDPTQPFGAQTPPFKKNRGSYQDLLDQSAAAGNLSYDCARGRHCTVSAAASRRHVDASLDLFTRKSSRIWRDLSEKR